MRILIWAAKGATMLAGAMRRIARLVMALLAMALLAMALLATALLGPATRAQAAPGGSGGCYPVDLTWAASSCR